jgi:hypothetical protein
MPSPEAERASIRLIIALDTLWSRATPTLLIRGTSIRAGPGFLQKGSGLDASPALEKQDRRGSTKQTAHKDVFSGGCR